MTQTIPLEPAQLMARKRAAMVSPQSRFAPCVIRSRLACGPTSWKPAQNSRYAPCKGATEQPRAQALGARDKPGRNPARAEQKPAPPLQGSLREVNQSSRGSRPGLFCPAPSGPTPGGRAKRGFWDTRARGRPLLPRELAPTTNATPVAEPDPARGTGHSTVCRPRYGRVQGG